MGPFHWEFDDREKGRNHHQPTGGDVDEHERCEKFETVHMQNLMGTVKEAETGLFLGSHAALPTANNAIKFRFKLVRIQTNFPILPLDFKFYSHEASDPVLGRIDVYGSQVREEKCHTPVRGRPKGPQKSCQDVE